MEIVPYSPSDADIVTSLLQRGRNLHREKQEFKDIKASAKGVLTQLQKKESILKVAFQATESGERVPELQEPAGEPRSQVGGQDWSRGRL